LSKPALVTCSPVLGVGHHRVGRVPSTSLAATPDSHASARLAPSLLLALTSKPNSLFIREESTLKRESVFLSLLYESYAPIVWLICSASTLDDESLFYAHRRSP
jgi:hypothetical protein